MQWPDPMCLTPHTKYRSVHHVSMRAFAHRVRGKWYACVVYLERSMCNPCTMCPVSKLNPVPKQNQPTHPSHPPQAHHSLPHHPTYKIVRPNCALC